jgi:hypothetical protein
MSTWNSNPERYKREVFEGGAKLNTKFLTFGKDIAELIELGLHTDLLPDLPVYDTPEHEIRCEVAGIPILSYLDSYDSKTNNFLEYKTGKIPWTLSKVQKHDQLVFYATALKWSTGRMPECCDLVWIETVERTPERVDFWRDEKKKIEVTGRIKSFHREFDEREVLRMEQLIIKTATEISNAYKEYINTL